MKDSFIATQTTELAVAQVTEAMLRLKRLNLHPNVLKEYKADGTVYRSDRTPLGGILYWLSDEEKELVKQFEVEHNAKVFHVIMTPMKWGKELAMLYVSSCEEEWEDDDAILADGYAYAYCHEENGFSEIGQIGFREVSGGLIRVA